MKEKLKRSLSSFLVLCMLTTLFPLNIFAASFDIKIHVYDGATNRVISNVGTATVNYTDTGYIQSQDWEIPELNQFTNNSYGRVEKVTGNWYFPSSQASVGSTVTWSINTGSKSIYYYVSNYQPGTGIGSATTGTNTDTIDGGSNKNTWNQTIVYHSNFPDGTDKTQTITYSVQGFTTTVSGNLKTFDNLGWTAPNGYEAATGTLSNGTKVYPWNTAQNGSGTPYNKAFSFEKGTTTLHLYAQWVPIGSEIIPQVTLTSKDGNSTYSEQTYFVGDTATALKHSGEKNGFEFRGWDTDSSADNVVYEAGDGFEINTDTTVWAVWNQRQTADTVVLSYDTNGGSTAPEGEDSGIEEGNEASFTVTNEIPTKTNFIFKGWSETKTAVTADYQAGNTITGTTDIVLYAIWEANTPVTVTEILSVNGVTNSYNVGDSFDNQGTITVKFSDNSEDDIDITSGMLSGFDTSSAGTKTITIQYEGKQITFEITVIAPSSDNVDITNPDNNPDDGVSWDDNEITLDNAVIEGDLIIPDGEDVTIKVEGDSSIEGDIIFDDNDGHGSIIIEGPGSIEIGGIDSTGNGDSLIIKTDTIINGDINIGATDGENSKIIVDGCTLTINGNIILIKEIEMIDREGAPAKLIVNGIVTMHNVPTITMGNKSEINIEGNNSDASFSSESTTIPSGLEFLNIENALQYGYTGKVEENSNFKIFDDENNIVTEELIIKKNQSKLYNLTLEYDSTKGSLNYSSSTTGNNPTNALANDKITLTITPNTGFILESVKLNSADATKEGDNYTFTMPEENTQIIITFVPENVVTTYPITITQPNNGTITSNVSNAIEGATVVITASPNSGYYFTNLSVKKTNNQEVTLVSNGGNQYTFVMPADGVTVTGTTTFRGNNNSGSNSDYSSSTYRIHIQKIDNGIVDSNKVLSYIGGTVELTITPGKGYELESLTVLKGNNTEVKLTKKSENKYTFIMPGIDVYVYSSFKKTSNRIDAHDCDRGPDCPMWGYNDLNPYEWYHDGVHHCIADGIMIGYGDTTFKPNASITRAMIVTMLWRLENSPVLNYLLTYDDIEYEAWYTEGLRWATSEKIVAGYGNNKFGPNDVLTREQMVAVLWRYAKYKGFDVSVGENTNILSYNDVFDVSEYAIPAMQWACGTGIIIGNNGYLMPKDATTRAQTATIFYRYLMNIL